jgi:hypothetical protein
VGGTNTGVFPSETAKNFNPTNVPVDWEVAGAISLPVGQRVGIERSPGFGNFDDTGANLQPNVGAQTTATFVNYQCQDDVDNPSVPGVDPDFDCSGSAVLLGSGQTLFLNEDGSRIAGTGSYLPAVPGGPAPGNCGDGSDNDVTAIDAADPQCAVKTDASSAYHGAPFRRPVSTTSSEGQHDQRQPGGKRRGVLDAGVGYRQRQLHRPGPHQRAAGPALGDAQYLGRRPPDFLGLLADGATAGR